MKQILKKKIKSSSYSKVIFKAYKKTNKKYFSTSFFSIYQNDNYYQKHKEKLRKEARERY